MSYVRKAMYYRELFELSESENKELRIQLREAEEFEQMFESIKSKNNELQIQLDAALAHNNYVNRGLDRIGFYCSDYAGGACSEVTKFIIKLQSGEPIPGL